MKTQRWWVWSMLAGSLLWASASAQSGGPAAQTINANLSATLPSFTLEKASDGLVVYNDTPEKLTLKLSVDHPAAVSSGECAAPRAYVNLWAKKQSDGTLKLDPANSTCIKVLSNQKVRFTVSSTTPAKVTRIDVDTTTPSSTPKPIPLPIENLKLYATATGAVGPCASSVTLYSAQGKKAAPCLAGYEFAGFAKPTSPGMYDGVLKNSVGLDGKSALRVQLIVRNYWLDAVALIFIGVLIGVFPKWLNSLLRSSSALKIALREAGFTATSQLTQGSYKLDISHVDIKSLRSWFTWQPISDLEAEARAIGFWRVVSQANRVIQAELRQAGKDPNSAIGQLKGAQGGVQSAEAYKLLLRLEKGDVLGLNPDAKRSLAHVPVGLAQELSETLVAGAEFALNMKKVDLKKLSDQVEELRKPVSATRKALRKIVLAGHSVVAKLTSEELRGQIKLATDMANADAADVATAAAKDSIERLKDIIWDGYTALIPDAINIKAFHDSISSAYATALDKLDAAREAVAVVQYIFRVKLVEQPARLSLQRPPPMTPLSSVELRASYNRRIQVSGLLVLLVALSVAIGTGMDKLYFPVAWGAQPWDYWQALLWGAGTGAATTAVTSAVEGLGASGWRPEFFRQAVAVKP